MLLLQQILKRWRTSQVISIMLNILVAYTVMLLTTSVKLPSSNFKTSLKIILASSWRNTANPLDIRTGDVSCCHYKTNLGNHQRRTLHFHFRWSLLLLSFVIISFIVTTSKKASKLITTSNSMTNVPVYYCNKCLCPA